MAGKGRALSLTPWWCFPCSLGCEESFSLPLSCLGEVRQSWSCWQVVSVHLSRVLCHQLRANLWKHHLVSAGIPILYLILKEISVRLIFRKSFPMLEVWDVAQGCWKSLLQPWLQVGALLQAHGQILQLWGINLQEKIKLSPQIVQYGAKKWFWLKLCH